VSGIVIRLLFDRQDKIMARTARLVVPGYPHHVTQRGNRRQRTFFFERDYRAYLKLIAEAKERAGVEIWAYCLMPNHVHLVAVPTEKNSLALLFRYAHSRYTRRINIRENWVGHLWQERFHSAVMDEQHLLAAIRYVELNPVRAGLCDSATEWAWSSVHAHKSGVDQGIVTVAPMLSMVSDWDRYLEIVDSKHTIERIRTYSRSGRPIGDEAFLEQIANGDGARAPSP